MFMVNIVVRQDFGLKFLATAKPLRPRPESQGQGQPIVKPRPQNLALRPRTNITVGDMLFCRAMAPSYLVDHLIPASDAAARRCHLQSANWNRLTVTRCRLSTYGCWAFHYASPTVWNSLPDELRNSDSCHSFKRFLKTFVSLAATSVTSALEVIL